MTQTNVVAGRAATVPAHISDGIARLVLGEDEISTIMDGVEHAEKSFRSVEDRDFLSYCKQAAGGMPKTLLDFVEWFAQAGDTAAVISAIRVEASLAPTPPHWSMARNLNRTQRYDMYLCLLASLMGSPFAWSTLQQGKLVSEVLPIAGEENAQSSHGTTRLEWHTEDAFDARRCDFLLLLCLRNPSAVPTTVAAFGDGDLSPELHRILSQPRFFFRPDLEHTRAENCSPGVAPLRHALSDAPVAIASGSLAKPWLRIDPAFMEVAPGDIPARKALDLAIDVLERNLVEIALCPGELLIINNRRAVHGRPAFHARYDGGDRWLKKVIVGTRLEHARTGIPGMPSSILR